MGHKQPGKRTRRNGNGTARRALDHRRKASQTAVGKTGLVRESGRRNQAGEGAGIEQLRSGEDRDECPEDRAPDGDEGRPSGRGAATGESALDGEGTGEEASSEAAAERESVGEASRSRATTGGDRAGDDLLINPSLAGLAVPMSTLTPDPQNARAHDERNIAV